MRILILLIFLFTNFSYAQLDTGTAIEGDCSEGTFALPPKINPTSNIYDCENVTITNLSTINDPTLPLTIRATGTVTISGTITFKGIDGNNSNGGLGGPGGGAGGSYAFGLSSPGQPFGQGGSDPSSGAICDAPGSAEGSGGGGGSLTSLGEPGQKGTISSGTNPVISDPGDPGSTLITLDLSNFISAGAGGGSGQTGCLDSSPIGETPGGGGGGGGGIRIISAGPITISGSINVNGGNGGQGTGLGGGGGGGSGGIIVLQSLSTIELKNTLFALGGDGGTNSSPEIGGSGGKGAPGLILLEDQDGSNTYSGTVSPPSPPTPPSPTPSSKQSLNSDIACGTVAKAEESNSSGLLLMAIGFFMTLVIKILFQFPMKLSRMFVHRN